MSIILARLPPQEWSYGSSLATARHCRLDPSTGQHAAYVDDQGVLHYQHVDAAARTVTTLLRFQLQYQAADSEPYEPIHKPWMFEFVPGMPGDVLLVQEGSCRILYASFPRRGAETSDVFLFGSHTAPITCFSTNGNVVLSGCRDGVLKLWRLTDGQLADVCTGPSTSYITAVASLGPLLVAAGSSDSSVILYDIATGRLLAVQRLLAGPGAVQGLAGWLPPGMLAAANLAPGGPLAPDGGGVLQDVAAAAAAADAGGGALNDRPGKAAGDGSSAAGPRALLAVASASGWLCVFASPQHSSSHSLSWSLMHSTGSLITPGAAALLAFSPDGSTLAVTSPAAKLLGMDAVATAAAGGQPGAVSLYLLPRGTARGQDGGGGLAAALLPPLLLEAQQRQQLPELLLWHQWCLSSVPVGLAVLPGSGFSLLSGLELQPTQVLQLLVVPQVGPGQVLCAERQLLQPADTDPQPVSAAELQRATPAVVSASADAADAQEAQLAELQQVLPQADRRLGSSNSPSPAGNSSSSKLEEAEEALLLNIAERDLEEVARAIAAAAGPQQDGLLAELLSGLQVDAAATAAGHGPELGGDAPGSRRPHAFPATVAAAAQGGSTRDGQQQQQVPAELLLEQQLVQEGTAGPPRPPASAAGGGVGAGASGDAGCVAVSLKPPQTLPGQRSWLDSSGPAAAAPGSKSLAGRAGYPSLSALAKELQAEQLRMQQQQEEQQLEQQQGDRLQQPAAVHPHAAVPVRETAGGDLGPGAGSSSSASQHDSEQELPCESVLEHPLHDIHLTAPGATQQQQQQQWQEQQQQHDGDDQTGQQGLPGQTAGAQGSALCAQAAAAHGIVQAVAGPAAARQRDEATAAQANQHPSWHLAVDVVQGAAATMASQITTGAAAAGAAAAGIGSPADALEQRSAAAAASSDDLGPQPRQLPALLRQQLPATAGRPIPKNIEAGSRAARLVSAAAAAHGGWAAEAAHTRLGSSDMACSSAIAAEPAVPLPARRAGVAPAHVATVPAQQAPDVPVCSSAAGPGDSHPQQQQQQQQQQQHSVSQQRDQEGLQQQRPQQQAGRKGAAQQQAAGSTLSAQQRLSLRRQQLQLQRQQQQQQVASQVTSTAVSSAPLAVAVQNSSRLLAAKIQAAEQAPDVTVDPSAPEAVKLAASRMAALDLPLDQQQYSYDELPDLRDIPTPTHAQRLVPKQLDAHWVASRSLKPHMDTLFVPQEWQQGCVDPQLLLLPSWPTPQQVVEQLLWPGQRPGVWS